MDLAPEQMLARGDASQLLDAICELADKQGITLYVGHDPYKDGKEQQSKRRWLGRRGFQLAMACWGGFPGFVRLPKFEPYTPPKKARKA